MKPLSIKLPKRLQDILDELARSRGMSRSAVVREALEAYAAGPNDRSATSAAGDLVGSLQGPRDLSTAAKHMRGFGE